MMMRLAVVADIHGNLPALQAVFQDLAQFELDHIIAAGDVLNWEPFTDPVLDLVAEQGCTVIRGNNELQWDAALFS
jgi:predicted phosphodiesterase